MNHVVLEIKEEEIKRWILRRNRLRYLTEKWGRELLLIERKIESAKILTHDQD